MTDGWFLVDTVGDMPAVLLIGARSKQWRPLSNVFRGSVHKTVLRLVDTVLNNLKQSQVLIDLAGPRLAVASPVLGTSRQVHGILMWIGEPTRTPPAEPVARAWEWELDDRVSPRLVPDRRATHITTMTQWLSEFARPADAARVAVDLRTAEIGLRGTGEWIDLQGTVHRYIYRCIATFDGPRMLVVSVELPERLSWDDAELIARRVTDTTAMTGGIAPALVHAPTNRVVAWLSTVRPPLPADVLNGRCPAPAPTASQPWEGIPDLTLCIFPVGAI
ncbi:GAF domain-containing protein [Gordonia sp. CPCC 206044]|uniref:GAF domain-containing protein n=1 Tax=Gordonia sp. CPCC 206044 TaxID=3140793 RepID=UPI003AF3966D